MPLWKDPKSGVWYVTFGSGTDRVRRSTGTKNRKAAQELHDKIAADQWRAEQLGESPTVTLKHAVGAWSEQAERAGKRSLETDLIRLGWWLEYFGSSKPVREVAKKAVILTAADKLVNERNIKPATRNRYVSALLVVLKYAADREWIAAVPRVPMEGEPTEAPDQPLTQEQAVALLRELPEHQYRMVLFSLATGLRQGNVTGLEWSRVDMERRLCWIDSTGSKSKKAMPIPLNDQAMSVLQAQRGAHERWVFVWRGERILHPNNSSWRKAKERAGITGRFRWHALRHTWATWHVLAGTGITELKELGGWSRIDMPMRYQHMSAHHVAHKASAVQMATIPEPRPLQPGKKDGLGEQPVGSAE